MITAITKEADIMQETVSTEDRKSQLIHNIDPAGDPEFSPKRPLILMSVLLLLAAGIAGFSFFRYVGLQKENFSLNDEVRKLNKSINTLEEENKDLALKTERAEKEKNKLQDTVNSYKKQNESLQFESKKSEAKVNSVLEEKTYLEDILINKTKEIESLKAGGASPKVINGQSNNTVDLGSIAVTGSPVSASGGLPTPEKNTDSWRSSAKKQGRVLAINEEHGFIVVDLGKVDGIRNGTELYLKRGGETIATLSVLEIRDVMAACNIKYISSNKKIEINDQVSLQK